MKEIRDILQGLTVFDKPFDNSLESSVKPKVFFFSTHDSQLAPLMTALKVFNDISPPYGAAFLVELHKHLDGSQSIKFLYMNTTEKEIEPFQMTPPFCETGICRLNSFFSYIKDYIPISWSRECESDKDLGIAQNNSYDHLDL